MCEKHKGKTNVEIAKMLNRHPATNGRELKRNKGLRWYRPNQVNKKSQERRYRKSPEITEFGKAFVVYLIEQDWSIEQISGRLKKLGFINVPSYEWIYLYIHQLKQQGIDLTTHLRRQKKQRKRSIIVNQLQK